MGENLHGLCRSYRLGCHGAKTNANLHGIVDMGSNGIRFSISDLTATTARILPTLYSYRNGISLYEAQYDKEGRQIPIPESVQASVIGAFLRFEIYCAEFGVPFSNIRIIATEATRKAINGDEFVTRVAQETGLEVQVLSQAGEGETGAWGIASSSSEVRGIVMDLGGGSTQITWMLTRDGHMKISPQVAISFPYGAAALTQRLELIEKKFGDGTKKADEAKEALRHEMKSNFLAAYDKLKFPPELEKKAKKEGGFSLYLSGGGFRGWGYLLLYQAQKHKKPYPISIINGFVARKKDFTDVKKLKKAAEDAKRIFRVSDRRRAQVPAVAFLVSVLAEVIPHGIKEARFCQGGVREGVLFRDLPPEIRMQSPIEVATAPHARPLSLKMAKLLRNALPRKERPHLKSLDRFDRDDGWDEVPMKEVMRQVPRTLTKHNLHAMANMLWVHSDMSKELSSTAALYVTSSGVLADTHGTSHINRALLALLLEARYEGDLPPREFAYRQALRRLMTPAELWWINYIGAVALVLCRIYPAGGEDDLQACEDDPKDEEARGSFMPTGSLPGSYADSPFCAQLTRPHHKKPHMAITAEFADDLGKHANKAGLRLTFHLRMREHVKDDPMKVQESLEILSKKIHKVGKEKNWIKMATVEEGYGAIGADEEDDADGYGDGGDESLGWGMKVDVQIKVTHPPTKDQSPAGIV